MLPQNIEKTQKVNIAIPQVWRTIFLMSLILFSVQKGRNKILNYSCLKREKREEEKLCLWLMKDAAFLA